MRAIIRKGIVNCVMRVFATTVVLTLVAGVSALAQSSNGSESSRLSVLRLWTVSLGNPEVIAGGLSLVVGSHTPTVTGRSSLRRGVHVGIEAGPGGMTARSGWADLLETDVGVEGWSVDAVWVRPWLMQWGLRRDTNYVGSGASYYLGPYRLSAAILANLSSGRLIAPALKAGVVVPIY